MVSDGVIFVYCAVLYGTASGGSYGKRDCLLGCLADRLLCDISVLSCWGHIFKSIYSDHLSALLYGGIFCGKTPGICGNVCTGFHAAVDRGTLRCCISGDGRDA